MAYRSPVYDVVRVPFEKIEPNSYNPNAVAPPEMRLLYDSIKEDGYTELAKHPVLHSAEWLSELLFGEQWLQNFKKEAAKIDSDTGFRIIEKQK